MAKDKPAFAAIPLRALVDTNLSPSALKVLAVIAAHDHLSLPREKGAGCFISTQRLASLARLNYSVASATVNDLERLGYIIRERRSDDARQKTARVVYNPSDATAFRETLADHLAQKDVCHEANNPLDNVCDEANNPLDNVCDEANNPLDNVCHGYQENAAKSDTSSSEYIPLRGGIDSVKQGNRFCKAARSQNAIAAAYAKIDSADDYENVTAFLAIVERELEQTPSLTTPQLIEALDQLNCDTRDIRIANHALRLIDKFSPEDSIDGLGSGSQDEPPVPLTEQDTKFLARIRSTWADMGDDPEKRELLQKKSGLRLSTIAGVTQGHVHLPSHEIKKLRDACVSL